MKNNKGFTLSTLIIYIICLLIATTIISTYTKFFYNNVENITLTNSVEEEYAKFATYLTNDINSGNIDFIFADNNLLNIKLKNGDVNQYIYEENTIHFIKLRNDLEIKNILMCKDVTSNVFEYNSESGKLSVNLEMQNKEFSGTYIVN